MVLPAGETVFILLLFLRLRDGGQPYFGDPAAGGAGDNALKAAQGKGIAYLGQMEGLFLHQAVDRIGVDVLLLRQTQLLVQIVHTSSAGDQPAAVGLLTEILGFLVVLIPDLAHQLLQDILQGNDALGAAVLIHHNRHVVVLLPQGAQQLGDLGGTSGIEGGGDHLFQRGGLFQPCQIVVLFMYHANDVVDGAMVDRQTGVTRLRKDLGQLLQGDVIFHGHHVYTGGQDLFHFHIVKFNGAADQLAFPIGQLAVVFGLADHGHQLALGDGVYLFVAHKAAQQLFPLGKQPGQRGHQCHQQLQDGGYGGSHRFRHLLGQALGGHLTKDQDHHSKHDSGEGRPLLSTHQLDEQHRTNGGSGDVHDVVADEDGGEQLIILLSHCQHAGGGGVTLLRAAFQTDLVQGRKRGFGCGKEGGKTNQYHQHDPKRKTAIVHGEKNHTQLSVLNFLFELVYTKSAFHRRLQQQ